MEIKAVLSFIRLMIFMKFLLSTALLVSLLGLSVSIPPAWAQTAVNSSTQKIGNCQRPPKANCFNTPCYSESINLAKAEQDYLKIVGNYYDQEAVFYSSDTPHAQSLSKSINRLTSRYNANVGFAVFDAKGVAFLKNNKPFPVENMRGFYVCYAAAAKLAKENLPFDYKVEVPLSEFAYSKNSNLYKAILRSTFLDEIKSGSATIEKLVDVNKLQDKSNIDEDSTADEQIKANIGKFNSFYNLTSDATVEQWLIKGWIEIANKNGINSIKLPISDLIYYGMNEDDVFATHILVECFLKGEDVVAKFLKDKGLKIEPYALVDASGQKSRHYNGPKGYHYAINNYQNARLFGTLINDQSLSVEIKDLILHSMRFAPRSQGFFSEGIKDSVDKMNNKEDLFSELKIFDLNSFTKGPDNRWTATTLAYVEFLGHPYVISIGIDNICGEEGKSKEQAQIILQKLGTIIFDHLHLPKCQHGTLYIRNPI